MPVRAPRFETRWFVAGDLPRQLRPVTRSVKRVDSYHAVSLSPNLSVKRRGDTKWPESKTRARAEVTTVGGLHAVVERWQKWRVRDERPCQLSGPWIPVVKQIWSLDGIEVARVAVDDGKWWSLAFPIEGGHPPRSPLVVRWLGHVGEAGVASSYASWLTDRNVASQAA
jgi:hypothetical protein